VVTTTVTEAGYVRDGVGRLDVDRPDVKTDVDALRAEVTAPVSTAPAKLVAGFAARRLPAAGPLTILTRTRTRTQRGIMRTLGFACGG